MTINKNLEEYIKKCIFPIYEKNDLGHGLDHITYVIKRSLKFASMVSDINYDMVYTVASYHDIGHYIDAKNHEKVSSDILLEDEKLKEFFSKEQIKIMSDAVYDHRASMDGEPRSIYGKIVSSADRNTLIDIPLKRTYEYRVKNNQNDSLEQIIEESRLHILNKFGKEGYAKEKMYFEDIEYKNFLEEITKLSENKEMFRTKYFEINGLNNKMKLMFDEFRRKNPKMSLDELLYSVYNELKNDFEKKINKPFEKNFDIVRNEILEASSIDEIKYYTKNVRNDLKEYIEENIFTQYESNDKAHGIVHIMEVIRRAFALNDTFKLGLDENIIYAICVYHDLGKYEDHKIHEKIAASNFINDENMKKFFTNEERNIIKEAIQDHRSSKEDEPRSVYGKLISSADRNTRIEIVFIRSFFVGQERMPEIKISEYLDYTIKRLAKKYDEENPENMFFEDETYKVFIDDMRALLKNEEEFKNRYIEVNKITSIENMVKYEQGKIDYII